MRPFPGRPDTSPGFQVVTEAAEFPWMQRPVGGCYRVRLRPAVAGERSTMDDFRSEPVAVRLAYRYPNGSMVSYSARALTRGEESLRVLVNEQFEKGTALSVWAPFQDGLTTYRVFRAFKSKKQPGYFEVILRLGDAAPSPVRAKTKKQVRGEPASPETDGTAQLQVAQAVQPPPALPPISVAGAAQRLADVLAQTPSCRFSEAMGRIPAESRTLALMAAVAAVISRLEERDLVHTRSLFVRAKELARA